jgi:hypothetical protein
MFNNNTPNSSSVKKANTLPTIGQCFSVIYDRRFQNIFFRKQPKSEDRALQRVDTLFFSQGGKRSPEIIIE